MDQRSSSWSKVVPTPIETLVDNVSDVAAGKDASAAPPLSPSGVNVKLSLTTAPEPCSIRSKLTLPPTLTLPPIACDVSTATTTVTAAADRERRDRAKSLSDSMPCAIHHALDQIRRHSIGTIPPRLSEISLVKEYEGSFRDVFGVLGVPMVLAFIFSAGAMFNQAYIQIYPSEFANLLMNTSHYDNGEFWLMDKTNSATVAIATTMLVFFGCCYLTLVLYMIFFRHLAIEKKPNTTLQATAAKQKRAESTVTNSKTSWESTTTEAEEEITVAEIAKGVLLTNWEFLRDAFFSMFPCLKSRNQQQQSSVTAGAEVTQRKNMAIARKKMQRARAIYFQFSDIDGTYHAYYIIPLIFAYRSYCDGQSASYDMPKLAFQTTTLISYLRKGFPITIVAFYCTMLTINWFISFYRFQRKTFDKALLVARVFYIFDLFFAVFAPLLILTYSYYNFHFDREAFRTKEESFPPGDFERTARLFADPTQVSVIRLGFSHLTLTTGSSIGVKFGLLYLSIYKWRKIIRFLIQSHHKKQHQMAESHTARKRKQTRHHLVFGVVLFLVFGAGTLIYTIESLVSCGKNCAGLKNCAVISYKWQTPDEGCPCLVFISRKLDPRTYDKWLYPEDVTESLAEAAMAGSLKSVQIVNRALPTLPEALQRSKDLQQLILIYTETEYFPDWAREFTHLQYLHIEGDFTPRRLKYLPLDMFSRMHHLYYLHMGTIPQLPAFPSVAGLSKLISLSIVSGHSLVELPSFDDLTTLSTLNLIENRHVHRLPSLQALKNLQSFNVVYRNEVCCNGYLTGVCDLTTPMCQSHQNESDVQCVSDSISAADSAIIKSTHGSVCKPSTTDLEDSAPTIQSTDVACGGVMYRQCQMGNITGMCFNVRMLVVTCDTSGRYENMRKLQIARSVGDTCDPVEEAWLGCQQFD